jgi:hypothetical protein
MTGQLSALAQGKAAGTTGYTSKLLKTGQTTQYDSELDDGYYQVGVAKSYTVNTSGAQSGTTNVDLTHLVSDTGAFTAADKTYTDAGKCGVFKAAGGEIVIISGSASNNGTFTTASATANTVVFVEAINNEADAPATTFKKREAISNNTVLDNNTGLTWLRYFSVKMGIAGDGYMPWSGKDYDIFQFCAACNTASLGGYTDWRVANIFETISLANATAGQWYPDATAFPTNMGSKYCWTSTEIYNGNRVCFRGYYVGGIYSGGAAPSTAYYVMLVRGGTE